MHFQIQLKISCIHQAKKTKFHTFLYAFFKVKNLYSNKFHALKHAFFIQKIHKVPCIIRKNNKKSNFMHSNMHFQIHKVSCIIHKNNKNSNFMHSNMHFQIQSKIPCIIHKK